MDPGSDWTHRDHVLDEKRFKVFCKEIGYTGDVHLLYKTFLPEIYDSVGERVRHPGLMYEDFGPLAFPPGALDPSSRSTFLKQLNTPTAHDRQPRFLFHGASPHGHLEPLKSPKSPTQLSPKATEPTEPVTAADSSECAPPPFSAP